MISKSAEQPKKRIFYDGDFNYKGRKVIERKINNQFIN